MRYTYLFYLFLFLSACHKEEVVEPIPLNHTLLIYLAGDNSLDAETYQKLVQIKKGWNNALNGNLLIYQDSPFKDSPRLLKMDSQDSGGYVTLNTYAPENSASPNVFRRVIEDMKTYCPADDYGLIVFSHGSGWLPNHTLDAIPRSIIIDGDNEMELTDLASAIPDHQFNYIIFEACYMAGIEVMYELKNKTDYIMASSAAIVSPGFTPVYAGNISSLFEEPHGLVQFANNYFTYWNALNTNKRSATISLVKTEELDNLAQTVKSIVNATPAMPINIEELQSFDGVTTEPYYFFDFKDFFSRLADSNYQTTLQDALDRCIVYKANTPSYATSSGIFLITEYSGMTTYIQQESLSKLNDEYKKLKWYKDVYGD